LPWILDTRGRIYLELNRIDEALADFDLAIDNGFLDAGTFDGRGLCHEKKGNIEAAKADYRRSRELRAIDDEARSAQRHAVERLRALGDLVSDRGHTERPPGP
jgi:tetratricopeptide (TPR) repeat protein